MSQCSKIGKMEREARRKVWIFDFWKGLKMMKLTGCSGVTPLQTRLVCIPRPSGGCPSSPNSSAHEERLQRLLKARKKRTYLPLDSVSSLLRRPGGPSWTPSSSAVSPCCCWWWCWCGRRCNAEDSFALLLFPEPLQPLPHEHWGFEHPRKI